MLGFALQEGWRNYKNISIIGLLTIASLTITLTLIGLSVYGYLVVESWQKGMKGKFEIEAFLSENLDSDATAKLIEQVKGYEHVQTVEYVSKKEAAERFLDQFDQDIIDALGYNPLPPSIVISMSQDADPSKSWAKIAGRTANLDGVEEVVYEGELLAKVDQFYKRAGKFGLTGVGMMILISMIFTILTVMGSIRSRERFIRIVAMSGGSRMMAQGPFIAMGGYYGLLAGILAALIVAGVRFGFIVVWGPDAEVVCWWIPAIAGGGLIFGIIGAGWAAGRSIREF